MNARTAERLLPCHQPDHKPAESRVQKAVRVAERDPGLKPVLDAQIALDERVHDALGTIEIPADLGEKVAALETTRRSQFPTGLLRNPAIFAALLSLAVVAFFVVRAAMDRAHDFQGREAAIRMVSGARQMTGIELEPLAGIELGKMSDWFAMNGVDRFDVPPEFAGVKAVGARVFKQSGFPVAQAAVEEHDMLVYVFRGEDLGIRLKRDASWKTFVDEDWVAAIRPVEDLCFMIAFHGTRSDMRQVLSDLKQPAPR